MLNKKYGFSTIELLIVIVLLAIIALAASRAQVNFMGESIRGELRNDMNFVHIKMRKALVVRSICNATFGSVALSSNPSISAVVDENGTVIFGVGRKYEKNVFIDRMKVENFGTTSVADERRFQLDVTYRVDSPLFMDGTFTKTMIMFARYSGTNFVSCFTPADIGTDDEYVKELGIDTRVGDLNIIGTLEIRKDAANAGGFVIAEELYQFSDARLKSDIKKISDVDLILSKINGYEYIKHGDRKEYGVIAQELKDWSPLVQSTNDGYLAVNYSGMIPVEVEALKVLNRKHDDLLEDMQNFRKKLNKLSE